MEGSQQVQAVWDAQILVQQRVTHHDILSSEDPLLIFSSSRESMGWKSLTNVHFPRVTVLQMIHHRQHIFQCHKCIVNKISLQHWLLFTSNTSTVWSTIHIHWIYWGQLWNLTHLLDNQGKDFKVKKIGLWIQNVLNINSCHDVSKVYF
jgi:hypothetical protein